QKTSSTQKIILNNIELKKESISGVSIDEEVSNMLKYQHAYEASAKVMNVIDGMIDIIVNKLIS
ncbi:MAG TPA: flagellar basal body rod C-terminal domain-containing protein, partial [Candidatus Wallbacteria bacterium]|nr:flagellar basal body rod C-terminal domain-containing protein [Candidatus Wallbacteria bacterium]